MYYLYLGKTGDFTSPERLIIEYQGRFYVRKKNTDWEEMEEKDIKILSDGTDNLYYGIEKDQFDSILSFWGGSRYGYKNLDVEHAEEDPDYGKDEEDDFDF